MDAQTYYDSLVAQGYSADQARQYTNQNYPGFGAASPAPAVPMQQTHQPQQQSHQPQQQTYQPQQQSYQPQQQSHQPQQQTYQPQSQMYTTDSSGAMMMPIAGGKKTVWIAPWIGVGLIFFMMFMPFVDVDFLGFELTGFELMEEVSELISEYEDDGSDDSGGDDDDMPSEFKFAVIAAMMLVFSPFVFLFTAILSAIIMGLKKHPVIVGSLHLLYFGAFMLFSILGTVDFGSESISVHGDATGFGFFLAGLAGIALCIKA